MKIGLDYRTSLFAFVAFFLTVVVGVTFLHDSRSAVLQSACSEVVPSPPLTAEKIMEIMPREWTVVTSRRRPGGWQQMGTTKQPIEDVENHVLSLMQSQGYGLLRTVANAAGRGGGLFSFGNPDGTGRVLWSLWPSGRDCTGFAWGVER